MVEIYGQLLLNMGHCLLLLMFFWFVVDCVFLFRCSMTFDHQQYHKSFASQCGFVWMRDFRRCKDEMTSSSWPIMGHDSVALLRQLVLAALPNVCIAGIAAAMGRYELAASFWQFRVQKTRTKNSRFYQCRCFLIRCSVLQWFCFRHGEINAIRSILGFRRFIAFELI